MLKKIMALVLALGILFPVAAHAANDPIEPLTISSTMTAPAVNDPIEPLP